jgi:hypothetical protein
MNVPRIDVGMPTDISLSEDGAPTSERRFQSPQSRCPFRRDPERKAVFREKNGFWWSNEMKCWMISEPHAIRQILKDSNFTVHTYNFGEIAGRLGITFIHQKLLRAHLPVAIEGEDHTGLRRKFDQAISINTGRALAIFENYLANAIPLLFEANTPSRFCVIHDLLKPSIRSANLAIAGIENCSVDPLESLPLFFDGSLSLKRRRYVEQIIEDVYSSLPTAMPAEEKYFRIAMLALNMNTLLGSISESVLTVIKRNSGINLKDMDWDPELPATALPMIERRALANSKLCGNEIRAGDRVQIFVDVYGFDKDRGPKYTDLYFAAGSHKCPGMNYSRKIWNILTRRLKTIDKRLRVLAIEYRPNDGIFNMLDKLEVEAHA